MVARLFHYLNCQNNSGSQRVSSTGVEGDPARVTRPRHTQPRLRQVGQGKRHSPDETLLHKTDAERYYSGFIIFRKAPDISNLLHVLM